MNTPSAETYVLPRWLRSWEQFWFTPADPSILALMRIACGVIVVYTLLIYSFDLQDAMGEYAWLDLQQRMQTVREKPVRTGSLSGMMTAPLPPPADEFQKQYVLLYRQRWGSPPPPPYPVSLEQAKYLDKFREDYHTDLRLYGLTPPSTPSEFQYVKDYMESWPAADPFQTQPLPPPPAYPRSEEEARASDAYRLRHGIDPRLLYDRGMPIFSLWFHVTDPQTMALLHGLFIGVSFLFTVGVCTRLTAALTWFGSLCYIHRDPVMLFGADTMMNILLLYLMIGPCGAVLSVDQVLRRWWSKAKPDVVRWWYGLLQRPLPSAAEIAPALVASQPAPSIAANVAIRLLQVHLCIIYLSAGLSKLMGSAWWNGTAVWGTIANYEFAPMQHAYYMAFLHFLGSNQLIYSIFVTGGTLFTLAFEIAYIFLIWRPSFRWIFLASAFLLHGFIGVLMGLRTFTLLMVVLNLAFLRKEEVYWLLRRFGITTGTETTAKPPLPAAEPTRQPVLSAAAAGIKK